MTSRVAKWGNSLALRVPRAVAEEAGIGDGDVMDVTVEDGAIVLRPTPRRYSIEELVSGITRKNVHGETDWGAPAGNEPW